MKYIATFYSHFGAIRFRKLCKNAGVQANLTPVPRNLSSSCGTCARYEAESYLPVSEMPEEVEQIVEVQPEGYRVLYGAEDL